MEDPLVTIGGMQRPVRLTAADGALLQKHFEFKHPGVWLITDVLGVGFDGYTAGGFGSHNLTAQLSLIAFAINRGAGKKLKEQISENKVAGWLDEMHEQIADGKLEPTAFKDLLWTVATAAFASGWVMQKPYKLKAEHEDIYRLFYGLKEGDSVEAETPTSTSAQPGTASAVRAEE